MFQRIFGIITLGGVAELFLLIAAGARFGALPVFAEIVLSAVIGGTVIRHFGIRSLSRMQAEMQGNVLNRSSLSGGLFGSIAGLLLILPGFIGDAVGLLLLIPAVQIFLLSRFTGFSTPQAGPQQPRPYGRVVVIEGEATEIASDTTATPVSPEKLP